MNDTIHPDKLSEVPWPTSGPRMPAPTLPASMASPAPPPAVDLLNQAVQGAHETLDRLADRAAPAVRQLGESVSAAEDALHAKASQWRDTGDEWVEGARGVVRDHPLVAVAAAVAVGMLIARVTR